MSRQLEIEQEQREAKKVSALMKALEYGFVGALEAQGIELLGFSIRYDAFNCLMVVKAVIGGKHRVSFVGSDSIINCILKAESEASKATLKWEQDKYHPD